MRSTAAANRPGLSLAWRFALRELRGGLSGFYIFLACIGLGVGAIAGVNGVAAAITQGIAAEGQAILGGDVSISMVQREMEPEAEAFLKTAGTVSYSVTMRALARNEANGEQTLIELKAVEDTYPLYGEFASPQGAVSIERDDDASIWADPLLLARLQAETGGELAIGNGKYILRDTITSEPDKLAGGIGFGPSVIMPLAGLEKSGLLQPGSLFERHWKIRLNDSSRQGLESFLSKLKQDFPDAAWRVRSRENAAPALARSIERFSQFLTLVGLTALIVGGVGVANSVRAFMDTRREVIATMKSLGAPGGFIFQLYLVQIMLLACAGIVIGLGIALLMPALARQFLADLLPVAGAGILHPVALMFGAVYGALAAFVFAVWPLGTARETPAPVLFRSTGFSSSRLPRPVYLLMTACGLAAFCALALGFSGNREIAATFMGAVAFSFLLLRAVSFAIQWLASKIPSPRSTELRLALGNIHRPGSLTPSVVLSLGLGLALIAALTLIDSSLRNQIAGNLPDRAPDFFFVDIQNTEIDPFRERIGELSPGGKLVAVPMLRGRITSLKGIPSQDYKTQEGQWVLRGDRGITYARNVPENSTLSAGEWWPADYDGPPLVSFAAEEAGELGLNIGDRITVNVLGREIEAEIASLRNVEWESMAINFVMVFSPNTLAGAPHAWLATLTQPDTGVDEISAQAADAEILRGLASDFPTVTSVSVREALETVNGLVAQLATAIRAASAVALLASALVLAGALAAGNRARTHDAVVLKTLGATRPVLLRAFVWEYALLGFATAVFALAAGGIAAWYVITQIMEFPAILDWRIAAGVLAAALAVTVGLGLAGTWRVLGQKAAPVLREL